MFEIEAITSDAQFLSLEQNWRELADDCHDLTYFLTWEFVSTRWKYFNGDRQLFVLLARDQSGKLAGIAPLAIATINIGPLSVKRLEFICRAEHPGHVHPYDGEGLDIIAPSGVRPQVTAMIIEYLDQNRSSWDITDLAWLSESSNLLAHTSRSTALSSQQVSSCYITTLPQDWSTYEETVLGNSESRRIRRHGRRLERDFPGDVDYHLITERSEVVPAIDQLIEMNLRRWTEVGQATVFDDDRFINFHREFVERAFERNWLRFYQLKVGDQVAAATCGIVLNGSYYLFQKGFDPAWSKYGPGLVLQAYELQKAIEAGCDVYDWAPGAYESKRIWFDTTRVDIRLLAATRWRGTLFLGKELGMSQGKQFAQRVLPEGAYQRLKRLVASSRNAPESAFTKQTDRSSATNSPS